MSSWDHYELARSTGPIDCVINLSQSRLDCGFYLPVHTYVCSLEVQITIVN
jgi:hypothetical protein